MAAIREKHRYLLVEMSNETQLNEKEFYALLSRELSRCIGEIHFHKVNPRFMKFANPKSFVIRSSLEGMGSLTLAFAMIKRLNTEPMSFYTLNSSGTIKALLKPKQS